MGWMLARERGKEWEEGGKDAGFNEEGIKDWTLGVGKGEEEMGIDAGEGRFGGGREEGWTPWGWQLWKRGKGA